MESILTIGDIRKRVSDVLSRYPVRYCILFGSYARGEATPESDVDLVLETEVSGFAYHGLWNRLEESLGKSVDLLRPEQVKAYAPLAENVRKDGKVIYGRESQTSFTAPQLLDKVWAKAPLI